MKRLTTWTSMDGKAKLIVTDGTLSDKLIEQIAIQRLAEYEDAEEQGLLVRLPCKVGDTVWFQTYKNGERVGIKPHRVEKIKVLAQLERGYAEPLTEIQEWEFGKTVFTSREAAEKALEDA